MTGNRPPLEVPSDELDRIEELVRYLADHDGRMPTDDLPLAWWLVDVLDREKGDPVRLVLEGIPVTQIGWNLSPKKAHAWSIWFARYDQLAWIERRGQALDEVMGKDKPLRDWVNLMLSRHHIGALGRIERLLLGRAPLWDFDRNPDTKASKNQMIFKVGLAAVRDFYTEHKHTNIPEGHTVAGLDVHQWWHIQRSRYASDGGMKDHLRQQFARLGKLGVDLRTDKELAVIERRAAEEARKEAEQEKRCQVRAVQRGTDSTGPILEAIRAFAAKHGHTGIPVGAVTGDGVEFGRFVDRWRRVKPDRTLRRNLEDIPHWTWTRTPASPRIQRPAPVAIPEDTTQMNRAGLRQFLPAD